MYYLAYSNIQQLEQISATYLSLNETFLFESIFKLDDLKLVESRPFLSHLTGCSDFLKFNLQLELKPKDVRKFVTFFLNSAKCA